MRLIFSERFWFVHKPFVSSVKFQFLAQFPVDHLSHPTMPSLVSLLRQFVAFAYYVINCLIFVTTEPTYAIPLRIIDFHLDKIGSVLLLKEIQFLFWGFPNLAMSESFRIQSPQFVAWSIDIVVFLPKFVF